MKPLKPRIQNFIRENPILVLILAVVIVVFLIFPFGQLPVVQQTYYFSDISGDDNRTAAEARDINTPWKTVTKLNSYMATMVSGDSVLFKRGETFYGGIDVAEHGIHVASYGSSVIKPVITSLVDVNFNTAPVGNVYTSDAISVLTSTYAWLTCVTRNGYPQRMGRYPDWTATGNQGYLTYDNHTTTTLTDSDVPSGTFDWDGAMAVVRINMYQTNTRRITHSGNVFTIVGPNFLFSSASGFGWFLTNHPNTLTSNNEWYFDSTNKKVKYYSSTGAPTGVEATSIQTLLDVGTFTGLTVDGVDFVGANGDAVLAGAVASGGVQMRDCVIRFSQTGIWAYDGHKGMVLERDTLLHSFGMGINATNGDGLILRDCYFDSTDQMQGMGRSSEAAGGNGVRGTGDAIYAKGSNILMERNTFLHTGWIGMHFEGTNMIIRNNIVNIFCNIMNDGAGIYNHWAVAPNSRTNMRVYNNLIMNGIGTAGSPTPWAAFGMYWDVDAFNIAAYNNVVMNCEEGLRINFGTQQTRTQRNLFFNCKYSIKLWRKPADDFANDTIWGNIFVPHTASYQTLRIETNTAAEVDSIGRIDSNKHIQSLTSTTTYIYDYNILRGLSSAIAPLGFRNAHPTPVYGGQYELNGSSAPYTYATTTSRDTSTLMLYNATFAPDTVSLGNWRYDDVYGTHYDYEAIVPMTGGLYLFKISPLTPMDPPVPPPAATPGTTIRSRRHPIT